MTELRSLLEREDAKELIYRLSGEEGITALKLLPHKGEPANEFDVAEKLNIKINSLRNTLYKLYEFKIVSFAKQRDNKKGWYIYFWKINLKQLIYLLIREKEGRIEQLQNEISRNENNQFFRCDTCGMEFDYLQAMENNFVCPSCEKSLSAMNKSDFVGMLKKEVSSLETEIDDLSKVQGEIEENQKAEQDAVEKKKKMKLKKKRDKERKERVALKKAEEIKSGKAVKKPAVKKIVKKPVMKKTPAKKAKPAVKKVIRKPAVKKAVEVKSAVEIEKPVEIKKAGLFKRLKGKLMKKR